jgi:hypothetical protein
MVQFSPTGCSCIAILCQSSQFYRHNPLCCFSTSVYCCYCCCLFRYDSVQKLLDTLSYLPLGDGQTDVTLTRGLRNGPTHASSLSCRSSLIVISVVLLSCLCPLHEVRNNQRIMGRSVCSLSFIIFQTV